MERTLPGTNGRTTIDRDVDKREHKTHSNTLNVSNKHTDNPDDPMTHLTYNQHESRGIMPVITNYVYVVEDSGMDFVTLVSAFTDEEQAKAWIQEYEPGARVVKLRLNPTSKVADREKIDIA